MEAKQWFKQPATNREWIENSDSNNQQPKQWFKQKKERRITYLEGEPCWANGSKEEQGTKKKNQGRRSNNELAPTKEEEAWMKEEVTCTDESLFFIEKRWRAF